MNRTCLLMVMVAAAIVAFPGFASGAQVTQAAVVTMLQGNAKVYHDGARRGKYVKKGDVIGADQDLRVAERSRVELRFPDGTIMRFAEKTRVHMNQIRFNPSTARKNVNVGLSLGRLWAKVKKLSTEDSSVEVMTSNAVAGVRGTVYDVHTGQDIGSLVRVYDGEVYVANPPKPEPGATGSRAPHEVRGPHAVPPPYHEVSREQWTAIVKAMQQIAIPQAGAPEKPQTFDPNAVADDWTRWNQERDKEVNF